MADGATMRPTAPVGPTIDATYDAPVAYNYPGVGYDATTFTPGAPAMTPA